MERIPPSELENAKEVFITSSSHLVCPVIKIDNVIIQPGGKPTIWKFLATVMNRGDEVLYPNPGYPIYESQIRYQGGVPIPYGYVDTGSGFKIEIDKLISSITPKTTALIYNNYQNPISASSSLNEMQELAELAIRNDLWVLSDDAYFEIRYSSDLAKSIVSTGSYSYIPVIQHATWQKVHSCP